MKSGFTLLECILVVLLCLLGTFVAVPRIIRHRKNVEITRMRANARIIYVMLHMDYEPVSWERVEQYSRFAKADPEDFASSTDMLRELLIWQGVPLFTILGGLGVPKYTSSDPGELTSEHNAWCIVEGQDTYWSDEMAPVIFTRNVTIDTAGPGIVPALSEEAPFRREAWIFVTRKGSAHHADGSFIQFWNTGDVSRRVLRP